MTSSVSLASVSYDEFFRLCARASERWGLIFGLPVAVQPVAYLDRLYTASYPRGRVLDYGCGVDKPLQRMLGIGDDIYHSCDNDPSGAFTYSSVSEIPSEVMYDVVAANQVFEHLSFEEGIRTAVELARHVAIGGIFQIGVPNPQHPTRQLSHPTHKTPWNYLNLCALLELGGLEPFYCARCNKYPGPRFYERPLVDIVCRVFRMDWCDTVYAVGRRATDSESKR